MVEPPDADALVLAVAQDEPGATGVKENTADVVSMASEGCDFPSVRLADPPDLHLAVVRTGHDESRLVRREAGPVHALLVLQDVANHDIAPPEQIIPAPDAPSDPGASVRTTPAVVVGSGIPPGAASRITFQAWGRADGLRAEPTEIPDSDALVQTGAHDEILGGVELGTHDIVVVTGEDTDALSGLPIPNPDGLVWR